MRRFAVLCVLAVAMSGCAASQDDDRSAPSTERSLRSDRDAEPDPGQRQGVQKSEQERDRQRGGHQDGDDRDNEGRHNEGRDSDQPEPDQPEPDPSPPPSPEPAPDPARSTPRGVPAGAQAAVVDRIIDGDTLELHARRSGPVLSSTAVTGVRLLEIDTPETVHPSEPVQCNGPAASDALARLAPVGSTVWVLPDRELTDYYDRTLLYLWSVQGGEALFVNRALVAKGFAKASLYEPNDRYIDAMYAAEAAARTADRGLWGHCSGFGAPLAQPEPDPEPEPDPPSEDGAGAGGDGGGGEDCDPSYPGVCIPPAPPDLNCDDVDHTDFAVRGADPHQFDAEGDGVACES